MTGRSYPRDLFEQELKRLESDMPSHGTIFVDLDETLVHTVFWRNAAWTDIPKTARRDPASYLAEDPATKTIAERGGDYFTRLRPGAKEFLTELGTLGPLSILTNGVTEFQVKVLEAHGLRSFFGQVIGRGYDGLSESPKHILIDDTDPVNGLASLKLHLLGIGEDRFIRVKPWRGDDLSDVELRRVLPAVRTIQQTPPAGR